MRAVIQQTIEIVDLMYARPVRSDACTAADRSERSMRVQGAGLTYAEDEHDDGITTGPAYNTASQMGGCKCNSLVWFLLQNLASTNCYP
jgi:hypothetical protein